MMGRVQRLHAIDLEDRTLLQMVLQVATDALQVLHDGNARFAQPIRRADTGELQDLRRAHRAGCQDDLALGPRLDEAAVLAIEHADAALALE